NVLIYRLPRGISLWSPASHCPSCSASILWHDNIPLLSFFLLGRRCRKCRQFISWRYPVVEAATCAFFLLVFWQAQPFIFHFSSLLNLLRGALFVCLLVPIFFIDLEHQIIPDSLSFILLASGIFFSILQGHFILSLAGAGIGAGIFLVILYLSLIFLHQAGMGIGDVKLAAGIGAFLGLQMALLSFFLAFFIGAIIAGVLIFFHVKKMKDKIPFGPFLVVGALLSFFLGKSIIELYFNLFW
ncbi:prepilin peptidase, partial [Candidatus Aerophobetes bacterium]|nr:prepilin peptidase [Candidatus Aerophobetes bacterium]